MGKRIGIIITRFPRLIALVLVLVGTMTLDALAYGISQSCASCTSYFQFLTTSGALSAPILASISSLFSLTNKHE